MRKSIIYIKALVFILASIVSFVGSSSNAACNSPNGTTYDYTITITVSKDAYSEIYFQDQIVFTASVTRDSDGTTVDPSSLSYVWSGGTAVGGNTSSSYTTSYSALNLGGRTKAEFVTVSVSGVDWSCDSSKVIYVYPYKFDYSNNGATVSYSHPYTTANGTIGVELEGNSNQAVYPQGRLTIEFQNGVTSSVTEGGGSYGIALQNDGDTGNLTISAYMAGNGQPAVSRWIGLSKPSDNAGVVISVSGTNN